MIILRKHVLEYIPELQDPKRRDITYPEPHLALAAELEEIFERQADLPRETDLEDFCRALTQKDVLDQVRQRQEAYDQVLQRIKTHHRSFTVAEAEHILLAQGGIIRAEVPHLQNTLWYGLQNLIYAWGKRQAVVGVPPDAWRTAHAKMSFSLVAWAHDPRDIHTYEWID